MESMLYLQSKSKMRFQIDEPELAQYDYSGDQLSVRENS